MKKRELFPRLLLLLCMVLSYYLGAQDTFQKFYGQGTGVSVKKMNMGYSLIAVTDTGYLDIETDLEGNQISSTGLGEIGVKIEQLSGGGYMKLKLLNKIERLNPDGTIVWSKYFQTYPNEKLVDFCESTDGGVVALGLVDTFIYDSVGQIRTCQAFNVIKVDWSGDVVWAKYLSNINLSPSQLGVRVKDAKITQSANGQITIVSYGFLITSGKSVAQVYGLDSDGSIANAQTEERQIVYGSNLQLFSFLDSYFWSYLEENGNVGSSTLTAFLVEKEGSWMVSDTGYSNVWGYGDERNVDYFSVVPALDGGALVCAEVSDYTGIYGQNGTLKKIRYTLKRVDSLGSIVWEKSFPNQAYDGVNLGNGFFALTGVQNNQIYLTLLEDAQERNVGVTISCMEDYPWQEDSILMTATFHNFGDSVGAESYYLIRDDNCVQCLDSILGEFKVPALASDDSITLSTKVAGDRMLMPGLAPAYDSTYNWRKVKSYIIATRPYAPLFNEVGSYDYYCKKYSTDLSVDIVVSDTILSGDAVDFEIHVKNLGPEKAFNIKVEVESDGLFPVLVDDIDQVTGYKYMAYGIKRLDVGGVHIAKLHAQQLADIDSLQIDVAASSGHNIDLDSMNNKDSVRVVRLVVANFEPQGNSSKLKLYPNPAHEHIVVEIMSKRKKESAIDVYDACGQLLLSEKRDLPQGASEVEFDLSNLPAGMYFVKEAGASQYYHFVIMR